MKYPQRHLIKSVDLYTQLLWHLPQLYDKSGSHQSAFALSVLSCFQANPGPTHWKAMLHLLTYLKGTLSYKITYHKGGSLDPIGFVDADYAGDTNTWRSTAGYLFTVAGGPVSWSSKHQATVALLPWKWSMWPSCALLNKHPGCIHSCLK